MIHVVAKAETVAAPVDRHRDGEAPPPPPTHRQIPGGPIPRIELPPEPDPPPAVPPAVLLGGPTLPGSVIASMVAAGARIKPVRHPGTDAPPEPGYRPSTALEEFVRCRDLTCRWPVCDRPAQFCDIDHAVPYAAGGPTHASNLRCVCRKHHLLKTFHGWTDVQHPDGTIEWTSPTGQVYTTHPGSALLFPELCLPTGPAPVPRRRPADSPGRTLMMPTRCRTRAQNRARSIAVERARNTAAPP